MALPVTSVAAAVAAAAAPNVVTGGLVAEVDPPPDFSHWSVADDLKLRRAMEAGAAMEALALGAVRFSRRFTAKELRARWRALLYDPIIGPEAAQRMSAAELASYQGPAGAVSDASPVSELSGAASSAARPHMLPRAAEAGPDAPTDESAKQRSSKEDGPSAGDMLGRAFGGAAGLVGPGILWRRTGPAIVPRPRTVRTEHYKRRRRNSSQRAVGVGGGGAHEADAEAEAKTAWSAGKKAGDGIAEGQGGLGSKGEESGADASKRDGPSSAAAGASASALPCVSLPAPSAAPTTPHAEGVGLPDGAAVLGAGLDAGDVLWGPAYTEEGVLPPSAEGDEELFAALSEEDRKLLGFDEDGEGGGESMHPPPGAAAAVDGSAEESPPLQAGCSTGPDHAAAEAERDREWDERWAESEPASDASPLSFSDVEDVVLSMDLDPWADAVRSAASESLRLYQQHRVDLHALEQAGRAAMQRHLTSRGALALIYGRSLRVLMTKTEVTLGRATADNAVDINIAEEAEVQGNKVSRQQATIKLKEDGRFYMRNIGRKVMHVNGMLVDRGQRAVLPDGCLIEVGGASFVFEPNFVVVNRLLMQARGKRSGPESMGSASESDSEFYS